MQKIFTFLSLLLSSVIFGFSQSVVTFDDLPLPAQGFWNGSEGSGKFRSGNFEFLNDYNAAWGAWSGFAYTNHTDTVGSGWANQYSAIAGSGVFGSANYGVSYVSGSSTVRLIEPGKVTGFYVTNATYAYLSMLNGDMFSKKFGGPGGTDPDFFRLNIHGVSDKGDTTGLVVFYLADFRADNAAGDYIVKSWKWVDLATLGTVKELRFSLESSDMGLWGMNTPAYFCIDNFNHVDMAPIVQQPIFDIIREKNFKPVIRLPLAPVFADPDSPGQPMVYRIVSIKGDPVVSVGITGIYQPNATWQSYLELMITPETEGKAVVTISATSEGKTTEHAFNVIVPVTTGIGMIEGQTVTVFPNPFRQQFQVKLPTGVWDIQILDLNGRQVFSQKQVTQTQLTVSALDKYPAGIYLMTICSGASRETIRLIKQP